VSIREVGEDEASECAEHAVSDDAEVSSSAAAAVLDESRDFVFRYDADANELVCGVHSKPEGECECFELLGKKYTGRSR
jgi:hypothetical protein